MKYYLRVEAVNLAHFVYDTHDISTIRGGSFLLLHAIDELVERFKGRLNIVTHAASQGLYWFETVNADDVEAQKIQEDVLADLNQITDHHATFLVAYQRDIPGDFKQVLEKLEAKIHWQQWHMPTVAIPSTQDKAKKECYLDGWRPGTVSYRVDPGITDAWISKATDFRRKQGKELRQTVFYEILGKKEYRDQTYSGDLDELSLDSSKGVLSGKIAFIHVDGNRFGSIRRQVCNSHDDRHDFDQTIQNFRQNFLSAVLDLAKRDPDFQTQNTDNKTALRMEVLLWGGDEMTIVVPAWLGWKVIDLFYKMAVGLQFKDELLTHRAAMIFCHHNAPILLIRQLAEDLLERTKADIARTSSTGDSLHYLALESFDMLQGSLDSFLHDYYKGGDYAEMLVSASELDNLITSLRSMQSLVSRSKVIKVIKAIQKSNAEEKDDLISQLCQQVPPDDRSCLEAAIHTLKAKGDTSWYMVTDLWDYLPE